MAGKCKICGYQAGVFNLTNGACKSCSEKSIDGSEAQPRKVQMSFEASEAVTK